MRIDRHCILLSLCLARHAVDRDLGVGAHQDAQGLPPVVPFSMWLPLHSVIPGRQSGLGFLTEAPHRLLPVPQGSDLDLGDQVVLDNLASVWVPTYHTGDFTISWSLHATLHHGLWHWLTPLQRRDSRHGSGRHTGRVAGSGVFVGRRDGAPAVVASHCSPGLHAHDFLDAVARS